MLIYPVAAIMMGEHGVEPFDLSLLFALWWLAVVAPEVPTGVLADRVSRRRLLIVSRLVRLLRVIGMTASPPSQAGKIGRSLQSVSSPADSDSCRSSIMSA